MKMLHYETLDGRKIVLFPDKVTCVEEASIPTAPGADKRPRCYVNFDSGAFVEVVGEPDDVATEVRRARMTE